MDGQTFRPQGLPPSSPPSSLSSDGGDGLEGSFLALLHVMTTCKACQCIYSGADAVDCELHMDHKNCCVISTIYLLLYQCSHSDTVVCFLAWIDSSSQSSAFQSCLTDKEHLQNLPWEINYQRIQIYFFEPLMKRW